jgi:Ssp1 endopeptidase immunity protein Rap1a
MGREGKVRVFSLCWIHRRHECAGWEKTMVLLARCTIAAVVFLSASAASAAENATLSADQVLPACAAFIADRAPREIDGVFQAGRCIGLMQGLGYASQLLGVCPPDDVTEALRARVAVTFVEAHPERMKEDFRVLAVEAMQKTWPCK